VELAGKWHKSLTFARQFVAMIQCRLMSNRVWLDCAIMNYDGDSSAILFRGLKSSSAVIVLGFISH